MTLFKQNTRRFLALKRRDVYGISAVDMVVVKSLSECLMNITKLKKHLKKVDNLTDEKLMRIKKLQLMTVQRIHLQLQVERAIPLLGIRMRRDPYKFTDFVGSNYSGLFRFRSPEDLQRLYEGLQLPGPIRVKNYKTTGQEILMVSLVRLSYPHRWEDVERIFLGIQRWKLQCLFYWFLDFMIENWSYLILNNRDYWTPQMPTMARAIELKLASLPNPDYRLFFPEEVPFTIFGFIDNTMHAMCRPGGGPITGGVQAERVPKYAIFGDSAYMDDDYLLTGGGRGMSSVREPIEWDYKDVKSQWKYLDYKHAPLAKINRLPR